MELTLETEIKTDNDEDVKIMIDSWLDDYRISLEDFTGQKITMPLEVFDKALAVVAKFRLTLQYLKENV